MKCLECESITSSKKCPICGTQTVDFRLKRCCDDNKKVIEVDEPIFDSGDMYDNYNNEER